MGNSIKQFFVEKRGYLRLIFFLSADAILISLSVFLAFLVRFEGQIPSQYFINILGIITLLLIITIPIFYFSKLYYFTWLYVSTTELISLAKATFLSFLILATSFVILREHPVFSGFPRSTLFVTYFFLFLFCGGIRLAKRIYLQIFSRRGKEEKERTLIVGAGDAGEQILRGILNSKISPYLPIGFVDDNPAKQGILIHGLKVLGKIPDLPKVVKDQKAEGLIIALPSAGSGTIIEAVEHGRKAGLRKIKIVPSLDEIIDGKVSIGSLREVEMEDLLGREPAVLDQKLIENFIQGKKVLITGAAGSIGSELCRQVAKFNPSAMLFLDNNETGIFNISQELKDKFPEIKIDYIRADISKSNTEKQLVMKNIVTTAVVDIQEEKGIKQIFTEFKPNIVFHAAAYKHVPLMEEHVGSAVKNNIIGTEVVVNASIENNVERFIFISTDKAVNPTSVMGATKRIGEMICQAANQKAKTKFISVRFGNVLDSRGSVIPIFREKIKKRETIEITHPDMKRYFMTTPEACFLVLQAGEMGQGGEVFVLDMGDPVKIIDLAKELIRLSGLEPDKDIPIVFTEPRPGEKIFEELLTAEEGTITTQNQKIFISKLSQIKERELELGLGVLKKAAEEGNREAIIKTLKKLIPNFNQNG